MKKTIRGLLILLVVFLFTACSKGSIPVEIGNLSFSYDSKIWTVKSYTENAPLELTDKNKNKININVSQETTYQHPMSMIFFIESMISDQDGFQVFLEPNEITVNDTKWYEYGYLYKNGDTTYKVYQRYYGKYYNATSVSYTATAERYEAGYDEAIRLMSDIKVEEVSNEENEAKAKEFLVGEWDLNGRGYLVLSDDNTYEWYSDSSKDDNNKHYGIYGCDVENANMNMSDGDGIYLVLFPEALILDGVSEASMQYKIDYLISLGNQESEDYSMVNMSTYALFTITKK